MAASVDVTEVVFGTDVVLRRWGPPIQDKDVRLVNSGNYAVHEQGKQADLRLNTPTTAGSFFFVMAAHSPR